MDVRKYLTGQIKRWRRRMNLARSIDGIVCFALAGGLFGVLCEAVSLLVPFYYVHLAAAVCFLTGGVFGAFYAFTRRIGMERAARRLDSFGFDERLVTAWEQMDREDELAGMQRQDAADHYRRRCAEIRVPLLPDKWHILALAFAAALTVGLGLLPSPARQRAELLHEVRREAEEQQKELAELLEALEHVEADSLTEEQRQRLGELTEALKRSQEELAQADLREDLDAVTQRLNYKYNQAAKELESLARSHPGEAGLAEAQALAKAAANGAGTQTVQNGGSGAAGAGENGPEGEPGKDSGGNPNGQESGKGEKSGEGSGSGEGEGSGKGNGSGEGEGSGEGSGSAEGEGSGEGNSGGEGSGEGNGSGEGRGGKEGFGEGNGGGRGTGSSDTVHDYISIPGALSDDGALTGQKDGDAHSDYYRRQNGLAWEGEHVDYRSVVGDYTDRAYEGLAGGRYPAGMESVIRDYFESLAD